MTTFAVVMATRDRRERVVQAVARLRAMDSVADEVIVVDDGSSDGTSDALTAGESRVTVVPGPENGPASARNVGVAAASAEWVVFLDDDDLPDDDWMATFRALERRSPSALYLSIGFREQRADGHVRDRGIQQYGPTFSSLVGNHLAGTFAVRREVFDAVGGFTDGLRNMEFTDLAIRVFDEIARRGGDVAAADSAHLSLVGRSSSERESQRPSNLVDAMERTSGHLDPYWEREPKVFAAQLTTAGVAAAQIGRWALARRWLVRAARLDPSPTAIARASLAIFPPAAKMVWATAAVGSVDGKPATRDGWRRFVPFTLRSKAKRRLDGIVEGLARPLAPLIRDVVYLRPYVSGSRRRLHLGPNVSTMNTLFNVASGEVFVGENTIFGHNCMVLTGRHEFVDGKRRRDRPDVPVSGFDIRIGKDCWIASGAVILGGVTIGDSVVVAAGAVVTRDVPAGSMVGGVPACPIVGTT